ncbi:helix-turn-helix domain-containing protein [Cytobacillus praedii]|uniref:helix-turn-helix domain-containing protein n=1 Tax=Cytobacillus praedii TaxID=1742358 RepID=UPI00070A602B|nr:helix-turn-helix domain-containing protein [Cytobacillus praedii]
MGELPLVLKAKDISQYLNVSIRFAYEIMEHNDFPTIRIGRSKRVMKQDFLNWIEKKKVS